MSSPTEVGTSGLAAFSDWSWHFRVPHTLDVFSDRGRFVEAWMSSPIEVDTSGLYDAFSDRG